MRFLPWSGNVKGEKDNEKSKGWNFKKKWTIKKYSLSI